MASFLDQPGGAFGGAAATASGTRESGSLSQLGLEGRVIQITQHLPSGKHISPVLQDCVLEILFEQTLGTSGSSTGPHAALSKNGQRVVLRVAARWAKSAALICVGDTIRVTNFTICEMRRDKKFVGATGSDALVTAKQQPGYEMVVLRDTNKKVEPAPTKEVTPTVANPQVGANPFGGRGPRATRLIIDEEDDTEYLFSDLYVVEPNDLTAVEVKRQRIIHLNFYNVGDPAGHDVSPGELRSALTRTMPTTANLFKGFGKYQDVLLGQRPQFDKECSFIDRTIGRASSILDVGCGTGIYSFYLRNSGLFPTLVDPSPAMCEVLIEKNTFFTKMEGNSAKPRLDIVRQDAALLDLPEKEYRAVLAIRSLPFLMNLKSVEKAVQNISNHMGISGVAIVTALNSALLKRTPKRDQKIHSGLSLDSSSLGYGAGPFPHAHGTADLIEISTILTSAQEAKFFCPELGSATGGVTASTNVTESRNEVVLSSEGAGPPPLDEGVLRMGTRWIGNAKFTNQSPATGDNPTCKVQEERQRQLDGSAALVPPGLVKLDLPVLQEPTDGAAAYCLGERTHEDNDSCFISIEDVTVQLVPNQGFWHHVFESNGLAIKGIYGDLTGTPFEVTRSKEMVFVLAKQQQQQQQEQ